MDRAAFRVVITAVHLVVMGRKQTEIVLNMNFSILSHPFKPLSKLFVLPFYCFPVILSHFEVFKKKIVCNFYVISIFVLTVDKQNMYLLYLFLLLIIVSANIVWLIVLQPVN